MSLRARLIVATLAGATFLACISARAWVWDDSSRRRDRDQVAEELKDQLSILLEQRGKIEAAHERSLALVHEWLDKAAVPRATILIIARRDAANWFGTDLDGCEAYAILEKDGWNVRCGRTACTIPPSPVLDYLLDPLTGEILSRRVDE